MIAHGLLDASSVDAFYASAARLFVPDGPGRMLVECTDCEIAAIEKLAVDIMRHGGSLAVDGALLVVPTPAGVVGVRRDPEQLDLEHELRPRRHDRGYWPRARRTHCLNGAQHLPPLRSSLA